MLGQGLERSIGQCGQQLVGARTLAAQVYGAVAIAPPFRFKEVGDLLFVETRPDQASWHAADDRIGCRRAPQSACKRIAPFLA